MGMTTISFGGVGCAGDVAASSGVDGDASDGCNGVRLMCRHEPQRFAMSLGPAPRGAPQCSQVTALGSMP
jgi:hypothetical protein